MAAPPLPPTGVFTYPGDTQIQDILLLPDGLHALVLLRIGSVNVWSVLVYHCVEIAAAIAVCVLLLILNHLIRRPRQPGKPYCRRCNYLLVGVDAEICPECGANVTGRNHVIGRSRRLRFVVLSLAFGSVVGSSVLGYDSFPRHGAVKSWCLWLSPVLYDWAYHNDQDWLTRHKSMRCRVVEIDLADGAVTRTLFSRDGIMPGEFALHPDGTSFFLSQGDAISQHDLGSGRSIASLRAEDVDVARFQQLTVNAGGDTVYASTMGYSVWAWHPADGSREEVFDNEGLPRNPLGPVLLVPYRDGAAVQYVAPENLDAQGRPELPCKLHDLTTQEVVGEMRLVGAPLRTSQDGSWIVCKEYKGFGVWDPDVGARRHTISAPWANHSMQHIMTGADARFVVLPRYRPAGLHLWDLEKSAWAGSYAGPVSQWVHARLSADRSFMAAVGVSIAAGQTQYMILTWDLPP